MFVRHGVQKMSLWGTSFSLDNPLDTGALSLRILQFGHSAQFAYPADFSQGAGCSRQRKRRPRIAAIRLPGSYNSKQLRRSPVSSAASVNHRSGQESEARGSPKKIFLL
jgi:hypothetical protein